MYWCNNFYDIKVNEWDKLNAGFFKTPFTIKNWNKYCSYHLTVYNVNSQNFYVTGGVSRFAQWAPHMADVGVL